MQTTNVRERPRMERAHRVGTSQRAAVINSPGAIEVQEVPMPELLPGTVLVRITHCGVCASNIPPWEGRPWFNYPMAPGALGHEAIGLIETVGDNVTGWKSGDHVAYIGERGYAEFEAVPATSLFSFPATVAGN